MQTYDNNGTIHQFRKEMLSDDLYGYDKESNEVLL